MDNLALWAKGTISAVMAFILARLGVLAPWVGVVLVAMALDYLTGISGAWAQGVLNSRTGIIGILKKMGYAVIIVVAMLLDWAIRQGGGLLGVSIPESGFLTLLVIVWLLINEAISILENLGELGIDYPDWFKALLQRLKNTVDREGEELIGGGKRDEKRD